MKKLIFALFALCMASASAQLNMELGGTGSVLTDPGANRIMFWNESANSVSWLTAGTGLTISGTTISASGILPTWTQWTAHPNWWLGLVPAEDGNSSFVTATNSVTGHTAFRIAVNSGNDGGSFQIWNSSNKRVLDTIDGTLLDGTEKKSVDWPNRNFLHADESFSLDYQNGRAYASDGSTVNLNYNTIGVNSMTAIKDSSYLEVTGSQTNFGNLVLSNYNSANNPYVIWDTNVNALRGTNPTTANYWAERSDGTIHSVWNTTGNALQNQVVATNALGANRGVALVTAGANSESGVRAFSQDTLVFYQGNTRGGYFDGNNWRFEKPAGIQNGTANTAYFIGGSLKVDTTTTGNVGGGEDNLISYSVPANTLVANGQCLEFDVWGSFAANVNTKEVIVYFGATKIADSGAGGLILNGVAWRVHGKVIRTGATTQTATAELTVGGTLLSGVNGSIAFTTAPAETLSGAITFKCTGTDSGGLPADNNIVQNGMHLKWNPAGN